MLSLWADVVWTSRYAVYMRYPQGGGLTPERQAFRERIRMEAAERFGAGASNAEVAKDLRVSVRSVQRWRRGWQDAGTDALRSAGPVSLPKLHCSRYWSRSWLGADNTRLAGLDLDTCAGQDADRGAGSMRA